MERLRFEVSVYTKNVGDKETTFMTREPLIDGTRAAHDRLLQDGFKYRESMLDLPSNWLSRHEWPDGAPSPATIYDPMVCTRNADGSEYYMRERSEAIKPGFIDLPELLTSWSPDVNRRMNWL